MNQFIFYRTSSNWYMRIVRFGDAAVWNRSTGAFSSSTPWANSAIILIHSAIIGGHPVTFPSALPVGSYDVLFYNAATPADSDTLHVGKRVSYNGAGLSELPQDL